MIGTFRLHRVLNARQRLGFGVHCTREPRSGHFFQCLNLFRFKDLWKKLSDPID